MRILVIGASSFVAKGIVSRLAGEGHEVLRFSRGNPGCSDGLLLGSLESLGESSAFLGKFDVVINYAILKEQGIQENLSAIDGILSFCKRAEVRHLIHFSSISVYDAGAAVADETSDLPADPMTKGAYASLKVATDQRLMSQKICPGLSISFVRPGFVLGPGLLNPFPGMGFRLPFNRLLVFGGGTASVPVVSRDYLHWLVGVILKQPTSGKLEVYHGFDPNAPTRFEFLKACNEELGLSNGIWRMPGWLWLSAGFCFDLLFRAIGKNPIFVRSLKNSSAKQKFCCRKTEERLGIKERVELKSLIRSCFTRQNTKSTLSELPSIEGSLIPRGGVNVIGAGRIVGSAHVEAFKRLSWEEQKIRYFDLKERTADFGQVEVLPETFGNQEGLWAVATPATVHIDAVKLMASCKGHCLVEKPLALDRSEWEAWKDISANGLAVGVCHNYRFKENVRKMREFVGFHSAGELLGVNLLFQSPPVRGDDSPWIREERRSRSLLMDYSIHFLDLACLFEAGEWSVDSLDWLLDYNGDTEIIRGRCSNSSYPFTFHLQQGFCTRTCRIEYIFRNYTAVINFFPDSFHVRMSPDGGGTNTIAAMNSWQGTLSKISEKLSKRRADGSHAYCYADLLRNGCDAEIAIDQLEHFYGLLFDLSKRIYD